jgi:RNA-binding protein YlmH
MGHLSEDSKIQKEERAEYIKTRLDAVKHKSTEITRIAAELFISKRSVYLDYQKARGEDYDEL